MIRSIIKEGSFLVTNETNPPAGEWNAILSKDRICLGNWFALLKVVAKNRVFILRIHIE